MASSSEAAAGGIRGLDLLREAESTLALTPLSLPETEQLLLSMFGDVLNVRNMHAMEEEKAQTAKHKESANSSKKKGD